MNSHGSSSASVRHPEIQTDITAALRGLIEPGAVFEIRIPEPANTYGTLSGYFNDFEAAAQAAATWSGKCGAVYITPNPVNPALLARAANRLKKLGKKDSATADPDISARRWLLVDLDPVRPAGISSSDAEHNAALVKAEGLRDWLHEQGWPDPIVADSGNGAHLLYRVDLPNNADSKTLIESCLKALAAKFDDRNGQACPIHVDTGVFNAARIWKLYGTVAAKGDHTPDRPHRLARILVAPDDPDVVSLEQLHALAALAPPPESKAQTERPVAAPGTGDFFKAVNAQAISRLSDWVPGLFPDARPYRNGYRVTSKALNRDHEEDLGIQPDGIKDFGVHDAGDPKGGKRTPIDLVIEVKGGDAKDAALWLCDQLRIDPATLGWKEQRAEATEGNRETYSGKANAARAVAQPAAVGPDVLLVNPRTGKSLVKHNDAAERLYNLDFAQRLLFDPVELEWREYQPAKGIFKTRSALAIEQAVYRAVNRHCGGLGFDTAYITGVTKCLMYEAIQTLQPPAGKICFQNGVLDLATVTLLPHSPDFGFTACLPFDWTPTAPDPQPIINWLMDSVDGHADQVQLLRAYIKACLVGRPDLQRFLELVGAGGSGKGTFIRLLLALLGNDAVHSTTLDQLEKNRFESAKLFGKKLVVITDAERWHGDVSMLKSITGQDPIRFEEKHKQAGASFTYTGMVLIAANQHTESTDYSSGIQRRRITVGFDHVVPAHARRDLDAEFEPYLPALAKWALDMPDADVTAYLRSTSAHVGSLRQARIDALVATNPIAAWLIDNCAFDPSATVPVGVKRKVVISSGIGDGDHETESRVEYENSEVWLYPNYVVWCEQHGKNPLAHNVFTSALVDVGKNVLGQEVEKLRPKRSGVRVRGIRLLSDERTTSPPAGSPMCDELVMNCDELVMDYPIDVVDVGELSKNLVDREKTADNKQQSSATGETSSKPVEGFREKVSDIGKVHHLQRYQQLSPSQFTAEFTAVHHGVHHSSPLPPPPADALSSHHPALSADADALDAVLKLYRGWATPDELAKKSGLGGSTRVMVAAQELATAGLALVERGMIKPAGVEVRS